MKRPVKKISKTTKDQSKRYKLIVLLFSTFIVAVVVWVMIQGGAINDIRGQAAGPKYNPYKCGDFMETVKECRGKPVGSLVKQQTYKVNGGIGQFQEGDEIKSRCVKVGAKLLHSRSGTVLVPICKFPKKKDKASFTLAKSGKIKAEILAQDTYTHESPIISLEYGFSVPPEYSLNKESFFNSMEVSYSTECSEPLDENVVQLQKYSFTSFPTLNIPASQVLPSMITRFKLPALFGELYSCNVKLRVELDIPDNEDGQKLKISIIDREKRITIKPALYLGQLVPQGF